MLQTPEAHRAARRREHERNQQQARLLRGHGRPLVLDRAIKAVRSAAIVDASQGLVLWSLPGLLEHAGSS